MSFKLTEVTQDSKGKIKTVRTVGEFGSLDAAKEAGAQIGFIRITENGNHVLTRWQDLKHKARVAKKKGTES